MLKKLLCGFLSTILLTTPLLSFGAALGELPDEFKATYPYRETPTQTKYAPWLTVLSRTSLQSTQNYHNGGENMQVTTAIAFSDVNPDHVIAGFDTTGVAISTDRGKNWYYINSEAGTHG